MKTCLTAFCAVLAAVAIAYGGEEREVSLGRVKANFVRVLRDANALVHSEIAKMGNVPPAAGSGRVFEVTIPHGVKPSAASCTWLVRPSS